MEGRWFYKGKHSINPITFYANTFKVMDRGGKWELSSSGNTLTLTYIDYLSSFRGYLEAISFQRHADGHFYCDDYHSYTPIICKDFDHSDGSSSDSSLSDSISDDSSSYPRKKRVADSSDDSSSRSLPPDTHDSCDNKNLSKEEIDLHLAEVQIKSLRCMNNEHAMNKIKEIYKENPTLSRKLLHTKNCVGLLTEEELDEYSETDLVWYTNNSDKIKNQTVRCKNTKKLLNGNYSVPKGFKLLKDDLPDEMTCCELITILRADMFEFPKDYFNERIAEMFQTVRINKNIFKYTSKISSKAFKKITKHCNDAKTMKSVLKLVPHLPLKYIVDCLPRINRLGKDVLAQFLELYKMNILIEELKPHGIAAKLVLEKYK